MEYGLIAEKLGHSFSKDIHNKLFDYEYELHEVDRDSFDLFMKKREFKAINVTIPYKEAVIPYLDKISDTAKKIGAVNTIVNENGVLCGYNTDYSGLKQLIEKSGIVIDGKKVLVLGSGGTSKTAYHVAKDMGARFVSRVSRENKDDCITYQDAYDKHSDCDVIINTTPVGMYPNIGKSPVDIDLFTKLTGVIDVVYNPLCTKLVVDAKAKGIKAVGGLYMLVCQAIDASEKFVNKKVEFCKKMQIYKEIVKSKQNIVLIGMPGAGKSTIGKLLAKEVGKTFVDTDEEIVKLLNKKIPDIFSELGESGFRKIECEVIEKLSCLQNAVIATGGGAVLNKRNMDLLKENGRIYFIDRNIEDIVTTSDRPLSSNKADLEKRYRERYSLYCERCDKHILICNDAKENMMQIKEDFLNENTCC